MDAMLSMGVLVACDRPLPQPGRRRDRLGLAIARTIVEAHGGTVSLESAGPGQGATVSIRLPLPSAQGNVASPPLDPI